MAQIRELTPEFEEYLRDESRSTGTAQSISFPHDMEEVRQVVAELAERDRKAGTRTPVCVQGGRTGLAAGAVPTGGHIMNLSKMNRYLGMRMEQDAQGDTRFYISVQPGLVLSQLRSDLADKAVPNAGFSAESLRAWQAWQQAGDWFFPTDPTEVSATVGGMVACNASGARSYRYGAVRPHVSALRVVLPTGEALSLRRGQALAQGLDLELTCEQGTRIHVDVPSYEMPQVKNASGYYAAPDMDAVDLFVGSDGTLGVICEIELELLPCPAVTWGVSCFFTSEGQAVDFTCAVRRQLGCATACEFFDASALEILRQQRLHSRAFASLPATPEAAQCCIYVELACDGEEEARRALWLVGDLMAQVGADESMTWVARTDIDRETQRFFRHAVPESVNMLIDERRKAGHNITKLGSDMSVPDDKLAQVVALYRSTLEQEGLQSAVWGHIGNNHLHVNVLPRDEADYARGKELFKCWAAEVTQMGGAVSAEHGVGKLKRDFLQTMYGPQALEQMARAKVALDGRGVFGRGNLFSEDVLDAQVAACAERQA
jgi:D-lactate dehydrogenase (cytochrome)